ncbi:MAG: DUF3987 domain-containing protein [Pseudomonadota bacterium]|nr:DUF3987 domain-containing protein [Pseudomonadota bacterium]
MKRNGDGFAIGEPPAPEAGKLLYRLPELLAADPARPVWMVEGESCADALARLAVTVTTTGAADSAGTADLSPLAGRHVIVWPDNDKPGGKYAEALHARLVAMGCTVEAVKVASLGLPDKGDCVDWLAANPDATAAEVEALPRAPIQQEATALEPEPLPDDLPPVPELNPALLPEAVRAWCIDAAENLQVPLDFTAIPAMVALAGALGRRCALAMKESGRWYEMPILWGCVIGRPSTGKSPALEPSRRMLERLGEDERKAFESAHQHYEAQCLIADARKQGAKEEIRKAIKAGDEARAQALAESATEAQEAPQEPRLLVNDATIEKLGELLNANPRGLIQYRDELAGWLASMDREGREGDRAFWLECWNGKGGFTVDRIGRGTVRIEACAVSLLGGVQPGKLADYLRASMRGGAGNDGLMQRLQMAVYPDTLASWRYVDKPIDPEAERQAWGAFQRLRHIDPLECGATEQAHCPVPVFRLSADALAMFVEWQTELMQRLRAGDEPEWLESHLSKYPALAGRLALVLHLADAQRGEIATPTMARALYWCEHLEAHARRIYASTADGGMRAARLLLSKRGDLGEQFSLRELYRKGWAGLDRERAEEAITVLLEYGHLLEVQESTGGRPSPRFQWRGCP